MTPLASARERLGLSRSSLAVGLSIEYSHLYRIERGEAQCSPALARRIAEYFDGEVTRDQILFPEEYVDGKKKPAVSVPTRKPVKSVRPRKAI